MSSAAAVKAWIFKHSRQARLAGREIQFPCPTCGHKAHYFNTQKRVGFCHAAACQRVSTVESLEEIWGEVGEFTVGAQEPEEAPVQVQLPKGCKPLVQMVNGQYVTMFPEAVQALASRNLNVNDAYMNNFQMDDEEDRLVIPVIDEGELVNYVSRAAWWYTGKTDAKRYMYAKGAETGNYFYDFKHVAMGDYLAIVENTFNAIWLRKSFPCTSSFGSHLTNIQIAQLSKRVAGVVIMWDKGAEPRAKVLCRKLMANGIPCRFIAFVGEGKQPDNYGEDALTNGFAKAVREIETPHWEGGIEIG